MIPLWFAKDSCFIVAKTCFHFQLLDAIIFLWTLLILFCQNFGGKLSHHLRGTKFHLSSCLTITFHWSWSSFERVESFEWIRITIQWCLLKNKTHRICVYNTYYIILCIKWDRHIYIFRIYILCIYLHTLLNTRAQKNLHDTWVPRFSHCRRYPPLFEAPGPNWWRRCGPTHDLRPGPQVVGEGKQQWRVKWKWHLFGYEKDMTFLDLFFVKQINKKRWCFFFIMISFFEDQNA